MASFSPRPRGGWNGPSPRAGGGETRQEGPRGRRGDEEGATSSLLRPGELNPPRTATPPRGGGGGVSSTVHQGRRASRPETPSETHRAPCFACAPGAVGLMQETRLQHPVRPRDPGPTAGLCPHTRASAAAAGFWDPQPPPLLGEAHACRRPEEGAVASLLEPRVSVGGRPGAALWGALPSAATECGHIDRPSSARPLLGDGEFWSRGATRNHCSGCAIRGTGRSEVSQAQWPGGPWSAGGVLPGPGEGGGETGRSQPRKAHGRLRRAAGIFPRISSRRGTGSGGPATPPSARQTRM